MISGMHALVYSRDAAATRACFKDVRGLKSVDVGRGWLIFALPPAEIAAHPAESDADVGTHELYLMCEDVHKTVDELKLKGVEFAGPVQDQGWGLVTRLKLPGCGGREMGLYQPKHALPPRE